MMQDLLPVNSIFILDKAFAVAVLEGWVAANSRCRSTL